MQNETVKISPVAVLVDGDNVSAVHDAAILKRAHEAGRPDIRRVYCDMTKGTGWDSVPGFRTIHAGPGKNGADRLLAIDAMDMALTQGITSFVLVSSDSDFTHLATRLREMGCEVIGMGEAKAPDSFRKICSTFYQLARMEKLLQILEAKANAPDEMVSLTVDLLAKNGGSMAITDLNASMLKLHNIRITARGYPTWRSWLQNHSSRFTCDAKGQGAMVRLKS